MVERTTFELNYTSKSVEIADGSSSGDLGTESVTTNRRIGNLFLIHKSNDVLGEVLNE